MSFMSINDNIFTSHRRNQKKNQVNVRGVNQNKVDCIMHPRLGHNWNREYLPMLIWFGMILMIPLLWIWIAAGKLYITDEKFDETFFSIFRETNYNFSKSHSINHIQSEMGEGTEMRMTNHQQQFKQGRRWTQEGTQHMKWHV